MSIGHTILPLTNVLAAICVGGGALSIETTILIRTNVFAATWEGDGSKAVVPAGVVLPNTIGQIRRGNTRLFFSFNFRHCSEKFIVLPSAALYQVSVGEGALSIEPTTLPLTNVLVAIPPYVGALSVLLAILPLTNVLVATCPCVGAKAIVPSVVAIPSTIGQIRRTNAPSQSSE